jgi:hypothetical protein
MREITQETIEKLNEAAGTTEEKIITRKQLEDILGEGHIVNGPTSDKQWGLAGNSPLRTNPQWFPLLPARLVEKFNGGVFTGNIQLEKE